MTEGLAELGGAEVPDDADLVYTTGIPTLRSSAHRVRYSKSKAERQGNVAQPKPSEEEASAVALVAATTTLLPPSIRRAEKIPYDMGKYDLKGSIVELLRRLDPEMVGSWDGREVLDGAGTGAVTDEESAWRRAARLEDFRVPILAVTREANKGRCESVQQYLSDAVLADDSFLAVFDTFVAEHILPHLKARLIREGVFPVVAGSGELPTVTFYYQRPPTLRLQPGPARAFVVPHRDADYGHQPGELNFWVPLTDRRVTGIDLWTESDEDAGDYSPLAAELGEAASFHGTGCRHYVNRNATVNTRVSLDFRIGVAPFYDPGWTMIGTHADHSRRKVET